MVRRLMTEKTPRQCFNAHKSSSKQRGIEFLFSYEEWITWWDENLGPNWMDKRGTGKDKYVMARKNDTGPYHPNNVYCTKQVYNSMDAYKWQTGKEGKRWGKRKEINGKQCRMCEEWKTSDKFNKAARSADGLHIWCKPCQNKYSMDRKLKLRSLQYGQNA